MMFLMAVDVGGRYVFNSPIPGALELSEYMMAVIVPFSIAYCAYHRAHVAVDLIAQKLPKKVQGILDVVMTGITTVLAILICWQNFLYIGEMYLSEMTSPVLKIPAYPFIIPLTVGMGVFALILVANLQPKKLEGEC
jgi:TRAP-type C4-dicarboxylate transport system permease small subunit